MGMTNWKRLYTDASRMLDKYQNEVVPKLREQLANCVEVVRCKDCACFEEKYRTVGEETGKVYCGGYCYHWDYEQGMSPNQVDGDDFCSYGERRSKR